jgi:hypothetical protein
MRTRCNPLLSAFVASLLVGSAVLAGCGGGDEEEAFDTLQDCYDDHHSGSEGLTVVEAITVCCLDHPIAGVHPSCGASQADCQTHVDAALDASVSASEIQAACADYIEQQ